MLFILSDHLAMLFQRGLSHRKEVISSQDILIFVSNAFSFIGFYASQLL